MSTYTIILRDSHGEDHDWETLARSASQAIMACNELLPQFEIVKVHLKGQW